MRWEPDPSGNGSGDTFGRDLDLCYRHMTKVAQMLLAVNNDGSNWAINGELLSRLRQWAENAKKARR
jgi:hypothetical protein